jgi:Zn-finger nucleic acid-binding protein
MQNDSEWLKHIAKTVLDQPTTPEPQTNGVWLSAAEYAKLTLNQDIEAYKAQMGTSGQENQWSKAYRKARKKALKNKFKQKP